MDRQLGKKSLVGGGNPETACTAVECAYRVGKPFVPHPSTKLRAGSTALCFC
jgi:hypothetical protein